MDQRSETGTPAVSNVRGTIASAGARLRSVLSGLLAFGTGRYPPRIARRLKVLNGIAWLIVVSSLQYAVTFASADFGRYAPFVWLNVALAIMGLVVPFMHRFHELAGAMLITVTETAALFFFTAMLGRESGTHINLIVGAAAPFFVFGLQRKVLTIAVILAAFVTHLAAWFMFPPGRAWIKADAYLIDQLYISAVVTTFLVIGAIVYYAYTLAEKAELALDSLLRNVLPDSVVDRLQARPGEPVSDSFHNVSVLFTDLAGFVTLSKTLGSQTTVALLNDMVSRFDRLAREHGIEKIKTIGDAYMAAAGLPKACPDHVERMLRFSRAIRDAANATGEKFQITLPMRIGIACGPVMAGIIGTEKFTYDVWGDPVNLAARLESAGAPGTILVSREVRNAGQPRFEFTFHGNLDIKGFGATEAWVLQGSGDTAGDKA